MLEPLVSVIVPVFNGASYIEKCILSLLNQNYKNIEYIIIDDGSSDETNSICDKIANEEKTHTIKVLRQGRQGVSVARNKGINAAEGKYIFFVDVDDNLELDAIDSCVKEMESNCLDLLVFGYYFDIPTENDDIVEHISNSYECCVFNNRSELKDRLVDLYDANLMYNVWNKVFKKDLIDRYSIRFPVGKEYNEDRDFVREYVLKTDRVKVIPKCYYHYYRNNRSTTGVYRKELFDIRKEEYFRLLDFFSEYGLTDSKTTEYISRQHIERVMGCAENAFGLLDEARSRENRKFIKSEIQRIVNDEITIKSIKETVPKSKKMKIMMIPYKVKSVNGVYLLSYIIHRVKSKYPYLFHRLKQHR